MHKETKHISHFVNKILDVDKNEHLISWNNAKYYDKNGNVIGVVATGSDITKEEFLAEELKKINIKYEQTFKAAQVGIAHIDLDGKWIDANDYLCKMMGYTKKELLKLNFQDITYKNDIDMDLKNMDWFLKGEIDTYHTQKRYMHKNGNIIWADLSVVLIRDDSKQPLYFISVIQDISQIKMLMFELESKKTEFENIVRFAPNPIMIYTEDGTVIMLNEAFSNLTGYTLKDIPTIKKWDEKLKGSQKIIDKKIIEKLFKSNKSLEKGKMKVITKNDQELIWIRSLAPLGNIHDGKKTIIYVATDITQMQESEELMLAQSRQAAMGDMIGMIAHQWRQPLSVISMLANNLRADLELGEKITQPEMYELTDALNEQTQYLSHTIDDFRTFLKPEKEKEKVSLCTVYEKLRSMIGKTMQNNQITMNFVNDCNVEFYAFVNELIQVFINLLNNSKDAMKEREMQNGQIDIITTFTKKRIKIEVLDNGGGIDKKIIAKLGEPYVSTKSKNGTGLGIYMSKMILQKHFGGTLNWNNFDNGTCFTIEIPLK